MSYEESAKKRVAEELRRLVLMRGGADALDCIWNQEAEAVINLMKEEITIRHIVYPSPTMQVYGGPIVNSFKYEVPFQDIMRKINEAERNGYKPTRIELCMKANAGNLYGLPVKLKLIGEE